MSCYTQITAPIFSLPIGVFDVIFSYSDELTQHRAELVCQKMKDIVVLTATTREFSAARNYLTHLTAFLKESSYYEQKEFFSQQKQALSTTSIPKFTSLGALHSHLSSIQEECAEQNLVIHVSPSHQFNIKPPTSMQDLWFLSGVRLNIDRVNKSLFVTFEERTFILEKTFYDLFWKGYFIKAIEVAESLESRTAKTGLLNRLPFEINQLLRTEIALTTDLITAVQKISDQELQQKILPSVWMAFIDKGLFHRALKTIPLILNENDRMHALRELSIRLTKSGRSLQAIETINTIQWISNPIRKDQILNDLLDVLIPYRQYENAIKILNSIQTKDIQEQALFHILNMLTGMRFHYPEQKRLALLISDSAMRDKCLCHLAGYLSSRSLFNEATEIANLISERYLKTDFLRDIERKKNRKLGAPA